MQSQFSITAHVLSQKENTNITVYVKIRGYFYFFNSYNEHTIFINLVNSYKNKNNVIHLIGNLEIHNLKI